MKDYLSIIIWTVVIGVAFVILWRQGYLLRLSSYAAETREELKKCTWPTSSELVSSSVVVIISTVILAIDTFGLDFIIYRLLRMVI